MTLGGKSPEPVSFAAFHGKVFYTKCTEEEFVIGQMVRCSDMELLYLCQPLLFPVSGFCEVPSGWNFGEEKKSVRTVTRPFLVQGGGEDEDAQNLK